MPNSSYLGNQSLGASPVPWLSTGMETPKACVTLLLPPSSPIHIPTIAQRLPHHSAEGAVLLKWATLRKEAGDGNPTSRRHLAQRTLQSSSRPETPPSSGGTRLGFAAGGPPWVWRVWPPAEGNRKSRSMEGGRGHIAWTPSPAPSAPPQSSLGTQACSGSRDVTPAQVPKAWGEERQQSFCLSVCFESQCVGDLHLLWGFYLCAK